MSRETVPPRSAIAIEDTWNADSIFPTGSAWDAEMTALAAALPGLAPYQEHLGESPATLADGLALTEDLLRRLLLVVNYAAMFHNVDTADQTAAAGNDRAGMLAAQVVAAISFVEPALVGIGFDTLRRWQEEEQRLRVYAHYFDTLERRQRHVRSAEVEQVLGLVIDPFGAAAGIHGILADADLRFAPARGADGHEHEITQGTIDALLNDADREVRRTAWEQYADAHLALKNTMASCLAAGIKQNVFQARVRGYESPLAAALSADEIPPAVFHTLIETFRRHLPTWHRYWALRRRALGYDALHVYDIKAPLSARTPRLTFTEAIDWVCAGMAPLGDDYVTAMRHGVLEQRWVDRYPNQGKRAGAFSTGSPGTHPFILMSFNGAVEDMSTLAHELGHSMHSFYAWQSQPFTYANYSIFTAEVASNFNQALVRAHLLATNADPDFQIAVIEEAMSNFHRYFFIMPTLARFELEVHDRAWRGEPLTADGMNTLMADLFREGYGDEVVFDAERIGSTWAQFSTHLYGNFYVYQYATGISAAHALADGVLAGEQGAVDRYRSFLRAGGSDYPLALLAQAGVDLTSPEPVEATFGVLARLIDRLEGLVAIRA